MAKKKTKKKKAQSKAKSVKDLVKKEYTEEEKARIANYRERSKRQQIKFESLGSGSGNLRLHQRTDKALDKAKFLETFGTPDGDLQNYLLIQAIKTLRGFKSSKEPDYDKMADFCNNALAILNGIQPKDEIEGMLAIQMIGVHNMAMDCIGMAMRAKRVDHMNLYINGGTKLSRVFANQMEVLKKYRGKGQQKIVVEHVHVNEGGQAIVGVVNPGEEGVMTKNVNEPHANREKKTTLLRNGNPQGDPMNAPRCGAMTRKGTPCLAPALTNGRCRMHGGKSTGPRTAEGLERSRKANFKHGLYSVESMAARRYMSQLLRESRETIEQVEKNVEAGAVVSGFSEHL